MHDDLAMIGQIVTEKAIQGLIAGNTFKLIEMLSVYLDAGNEGMGVFVPLPWVVFDNFVAFHLLRA